VQILIRSRVENWDQFSTDVGRLAHYYIDSEGMVDRVPDGVDVWGFCCLVPT
jgi:hypothetical protein